eukprot:8874003-Alexandrium_andersonii.AAC.1
MTTHTHVSIHECANSGPRRSMNHSVHQRPKAKGREKEREAERQREGEKAREGEENGQKGREREGKKER